jgi:hypothetical protein
LSIKSLYNLIDVLWYLVYLLSEALNDSFMIFSHQRPSPSVIPYLIEAVRLRCM